MTIDSIVLFVLISLLALAVVISYQLLKQPLKVEEETNEQDEARQLLMRRRTIVENEDKMSATMDHIKWLDSVRKYYKKSEKASD